MLRFNIRVHPAPVIGNATTNPLWCVLLLVVAGLSACSDPASPPPPQPNQKAAPETPASPIFSTLVEGMPSSRIQALLARDASLSALQPRGGFAPRFVLNVSKRWTPGQTLTVAFRGGSEELHRRIAQVAATWTLHANIGLDFGYQQGHGYRPWEPSDAYTADVRIGFDEAGYFSCVGRDSVDPVCATPAQSSMNFFEFDRALPRNWQSVVLHEWGHALGLEHEHQNPTGGCEAELRWEDDTGYQATTSAGGVFVSDSQGRRPGIYTVLGGPPNNWPKATTDFNIRTLKNSRNIDSSQLDLQSIMKYDFEEWMYILGTKSKCFTRRNEDLSPLDRAGIAKLYPRDPAAILTEVRAREGAIATLQGNRQVDDEVLRALNKSADALGRVNLPF